MRRRSSLRVVPRVPPVCLSTTAALCSKVLGLLPCAPTSWRSPGRSLRRVSALFFRLARRSTLPGDPPPSFFRFFPSSGPGPPLGSFPASWCLCAAARCRCRRFFLAMRERGGHQPLLGPGSTALSLACTALHPAVVEVLAARRCALLAGLTLLSLPHSSPFHLFAWIRLNPTILTPM